MPHLVNHFSSTVINYEHPLLGAILCQLPQYFTVPPVLTKKTEKKAPGTSYSTQRQWSCPNAISIEIYYSTVTLRCVSIDTVMHWYVLAQTLLQVPNWIFREPIQSRSPCTLGPMVSISLSFAPAPLSRSLVNIKTNCCVVVVDRPFSALSWCTSCSTRLYLRNATSDVSPSFAWLFWGFYWVPHTNLGG